MRKIIEHQVPGAAELVEVLVLDKPGLSRANHRYQLRQINADLVSTVLNFQNGDVAEAGVNGIDSEGEEEE